MTTMLEAAVEVPVSATDPINETILKISEDRLPGFRRDPIRDIASMTGLDTDTIITRIQAMLRAGTIRRVRQTLLATNLAQGALVAWKISDDKIDAAFDFIFRNDPFSGHCVIRNSETEKTEWRLWTTLKVPKPYSIENHCEFLRQTVGAENFRIMPPLRVFALGVGHSRRKGLPVGSMSATPAEAKEPSIVDLNELEWEVLMQLKREFAPEEITLNMWAKRAHKAHVSLEMFCSVAERLDMKGVIGRFSTFLEHKKKVAGEESVSSFNGLFHWAVPTDRVIEAGSEIGRFHILTHCYYREAGPELNNVNIMAMGHGTDKENVLAHKAAIDAYLASLGIPVTYTNVYWGGRAEIKPSEISPELYERWARQQGLAI
jgi:DNA-binding Lrp family transcriptional regulator